MGADVRPAVNRAKSARSLIAVLYKNIPQIRTIVSGSDKRFETGSRRSRRVHRQRAVRTYGQYHPIVGNQTRIRALRPMVSFRARVGQTAPLTYQLSLPAVLRKLGLQIRLGQVRRCLAQRIRPFFGQRQ